jgi:membrane protein
VSVVYGSLTTSIVVLFSLEIGATALLLGAQVISEYERIGKGDTQVKAQPLRIK